MLRRKVDLPFGRGASAHASKPLVVGVVVIMIMVAAFAGKGAYDAATARHFTVERAEAAVAVEGRSAEEGSSQTADSIAVHVAGAVKSPGVVSLPPASRVDDAVSAAGGFSEGAATDALNLARPVKDGEQVLVPMRNESEEPAGASESPILGATSSKKVNINTATASELETLSGIGPALAARIVSDREQHGSFSKPHDITRVSGIGERTYERFADDIVVG